MVFQTEYDFLLPRGYVDDAGMLHREGKMRLATAADEILPMRDPRVAQNAEYLPVILFARVITSLGSLRAIDTRVIEKFFIADMRYLQDMYNRINQAETPEYSGICPHCNEKVRIPVNFMTAGR